MSASLVKRSARRNEPGRCRVVEMEDTMGKGIRALISALILATALCSMLMTRPGSAGATSTRQASRCRASQLAARGGFQGATGSLAGGVVLTNRGKRPCVLSGTPGVQLESRGRPLPVTALRLTHAFSSNGAPVGRVEVLPGGKAFVQLWWSNWCGRAIAAPFRIAINWPGGGRLSIAPLPLAGPGRVPGPRCDSPGSRSTLMIGSFQPPANSPGAEIQAYYQDINAHLYSYAYLDVAPPGRPLYRAFAAGYAGTRHVALDEVVLPSYRVRQAGTTYACVGVRLSARQSNGAVLHFGGWYMAVTANDWRSLLLPGSMIRLGAPALAPSRTVCARHITAGAFVSDMGPAGQLSLIVPHTSARDATMAATISLWNAGRSVIRVATGCPHGNPFILVDSAAGPASTRSAPHCRGRAIALPPNGNLTRRLAMHVRGPVLRAAAIIAGKGMSSYIEVAGSPLRLGPSGLPRVAVLRGPRG